MEEWRPVVGYEALYHVSDMGRVKRLQGTYHLTVDGDYILSPGLNTYGYPQVMLCSSTRRKMAPVHKLVLEAFDELMPAGMECNHKNGDKQDNRHENLEWATHQENMQHAYKHLQLNRARGEDNGMTILTEDDVHFIRKHAHSTSQLALARQFGVDRTTIWRILSRRTWKHV